jgi:hypothetical protein
VKKKFGHYVTHFTQWNHPGIDAWKKHYGFLDWLDPRRVQLLLDVESGGFHDTVLTSDILLVTNFSQSPVTENLAKFAQIHSDKQFVYLADVNIYNYPLPPNVKFFKYRHWFLPLKHLMSIPNLTIPKVKSKIINKKFSSLSWNAKQARSVVTAALLTYARDQSIVSWHGVQLSQSHKYLLDSAKNHPYFSELDWGFLNYILTVDNYYSSAVNDYDKNMTDFIGDSYQTCLINFSNETENIGWHRSDSEEYTHAGPFFTEKTWKPLIAGNLLLNSGQPYCYDFLKNQYQIPIDYSIDLEYDTVKGDFDRLLKLTELIRDLSQTPLSDLIDQNIDNCELVQNTVSNPDYFRQFELYNLQQDQIILEEFSRL